MPILEHHGHLEISDEVRDQLISISPATIDRILKPWRSNTQYKKKSLNSSANLIKKQIPIRTFSDWHEKRPGFFEIDLVWHCGQSASGFFLSTLVLTDIATGWTECVALINRSKHTIINALERISKLIPFKILGLDTDNGSEFMNADLIDYCIMKGITLTRSRAYKKNDQSFVEQKNGAIVRKLIGYDRFEGLRAYKQLAELYRALRLYVNFFQPSMKLKKKIRKSHRVYRQYYSAETPFRRLIDSNSVEIKDLDKLNKIVHDLDPIRLLKQLDTLQDALWQHSVPIGETVSQEGQTEENQNNLTGIEFCIRSRLSKERNYFRSKKKRKPRWWRTRQDPFREIWQEVQDKLEMNPERTAISILKELQKLYPGRYKDGQLRTLQRRVQAWRKKAIILFDENLFSDEQFLGKELTVNLKSANALI